MISDCLYVGYQSGIWVSEEYNGFRRIVQDSCNILLLLRSGVNIIPGSWGRVSETDMKRL